MISDARAIAVVPVRTCQRAVRRRELRKIVPLADTTIYEMERRGEFPQRFYLTSKCVVWDLDEVERWLAVRLARRVEAYMPQTPMCGFAGSGQLEASTHSESPTMAHLTL